MTAQIISLNQYKFRRYQMDLPKRKAIELATMNHMDILQAKLQKAREIESKERVTE